MEEFKNEKINVIAIVGPTASGKTSLSVELAKIFGCEIVSADSMQIYKGMDIATAKPTKKEMSSITHHLIGYIKTDENYSVGRYVEDAKDCINKISKTGKIPMIVGGTGLYIDTLLNNISLPSSSEDEEIRKSLYKILKEKGVDYLLGMLMEFDNESAIRLKENINAKRIIRAIEVYKTTGITMTKHLENSKKEESPFNYIKIGLNWERSELYQRINTRVDQMISSGLLEETKEFLNKNHSATAKMAIGYKELKPYFENDMTLEEASENLKRETRRYAKRQMTWFNKNGDVKWIEVDSSMSSEILVEKAKNIIKEFLINGCE